MIQQNKTLQTGISMLEVLVSLLLLSIIISLAIPGFLKLQQGRTKKLFFSDFSMLVTDTMHQAIMTKKMHQIFFDINQRKIQVKIFDEKAEGSNIHAKFKPADASVFKTTMNIPESFLFPNFFINGADEVKPGDKLSSVFFYILPDGTSQPINININDENETKKPRFCIMINPFFSKVSLHEDFFKS